LPQRTLEISIDKPAFEYRYKICIKPGIFRCKEWETIIDYYDFTDMVMRQKLIDIGFVLKGRINP